MRAPRTRRSRRTCLWSSTSSSRGWSPFNDLAQADDTVGYLAVHDEILGFGADTIVTGHVGRLGTNEDVELTTEYMGDIQTAALDALQSVALDPSSPRPGTRIPSCCSTATSTRSSRPVRPRSSPSRRTDSPREWVDAAWSPSLTHRGTPLMGANGLGQPGPRSDRDEAGRNWPQ